MTAQTLQPGSIYINRVYKLYINSQQQPVQIFYFDNEIILRDSQIIYIRPPTLRLSIPPTPSRKQTLLTPLTSGTPARLALFLFCPCCNWITVPLSGSVARMTPGPRPSLHMQWSLLSSPPANGQMTSAKATTAPGEIN